MLMSEIDTLPRGILSNSLTPNTNQHNYTIVVGQSQDRPVIHPNAQDVASHDFNPQMLRLSLHLHLASLPVQATRELLRPFPHRYRLPLPGLLQQR